MLPLPVEFSVYFHIKKSKFLFICTAFNTLVPVFLGELKMIVSRSHQIFTTIDPYIIDRVTVLYVPFLSGFLFSRRTRDSFIY